jgi:RNA polymerase sigma factor (sigma-70 family)
VKEISLQRDEHTMSDDMPAHSARRDTDSRLCLIECVEQHIESLLGSISLYARRMGLDGGADARGLAVEILQETVVEALDHAGSFTATRQPIAWLLGISVNVIRRKKVELAKHARREISLGRLAAQQPLPISEQDVLDRLMLISEPASDPGHALESDEEIAALLSLVSFADQEVIRLAVLEDLERETLAQRLGIPAGTARMRLHRALRRLRSAWFKQQETERKGERHE